MPRTYPAIREKLLLENAVESLKLRNIQLVSSRRGWNSVGNARTTDNMSVYRNYYGGENENYIIYYITLISVPHTQIILL